jgi:hypothetical protein
MDTTHGDAHQARSRVRHYERVMSELLNAARMKRAKRLSTIAAAEIAQAVGDPTTEDYLRTARILMEKCVLLGAPPERYRSGAWRERGLTGSR